MKIENLSLNRRRIFLNEINAKAVRLLPQPQNALLKRWLKVKAKSPTWDRLLTIATDFGSQQYVEVAESLAIALVECGMASLEQKQRHPGVWINIALNWIDYEALNAELGLITSVARNSAFIAAWENAQNVYWERSELEGAYLTLREASSKIQGRRLALLLKLNDWLCNKESGTRREFSLYARDNTKDITRAEWAWLDEIIELENCGIAKHEPALWIAGDLQLQIEDRWFDIGAADDFIALTPTTLKKVSTIKSLASQYRLIENRTSFENVVRKESAIRNQIIVWLPGYAPGWWRDCITTLLAKLPLSAKISCDADPDGVQIALQAAELWTARTLPWEPEKMGVIEASAARHTRPLTNRDTQLAARLLERPSLPSSIRALLEWQIKHRIKVEQENWL